MKVLQSCPRRLRTSRRWLSALSFMVVSSAAMVTIGSGLYNNRYCWKTEKDTAVASITALVHDLELGESSITWVQIDMQRKLEHDHRLWGKSLVRSWQKWEKAGLMHFVHSTAWYPGPKSCTTLSCALHPDAKYRTSSTLPSFARSQEHNAHDFCILYKAVTRLTRKPQHDLAISRFPRFPPLESPSLPFWLPSSLSSPFSCVCARPSLLAFRLHASSFSRRCRSSRVA